MDGFKWENGKNNLFSSSAAAQHNFTIPPLAGAGMNEFTVNHFNNSSTSSGNMYRSRGFPLHGKRKSSLEESSFHPRTKQLITESRITSSMQRLNLNSNMMANTNRSSDEGFFEENAFDLNDSDDEELDLTEGSNKPKSLPRFTLSPDIKEKLKETNDSILPRKIIDMINQSCMALVPYNPSPIIDTLQFYDSNKTTNSTLPVSSKVEAGASHIMNLDSELPEDEDMGD